MIPLVNFFLEPVRKINRGIREKGRRDRGEGERGQGRQSHCEVANHVIVTLGGKKLIGK